jgi:hypothetical protein
MDEPGLAVAVAEQDQVFVQDPDLLRRAGRIVCNAKPVPVPTTHFAGWCVGFDF